MTGSNYFCEEVLDKALLLTVNNMIVRKPYLCVYWVLSQAMNCSDTSTCTLALHMPKQVLHNSC